MEEYLQYMKTLRSQMNDVEDQAAKVSIEEQMQITTIQTVEKDIAYAKSETRKLRDETDQMTMRKGQICTQILEKQRKISCMESDSSTLAQTLELIQQERASVSAKLASKRSYYMKVTDEARTKLEEQQSWFVSQMSIETGQQGSNDETWKHLMELLGSAKAKLEQQKQMKSNFTLENTKMGLLIEHVRRKANELKLGLSSMEVKVLEEEYSTVLSDKAKEMDYIPSLQSEIEKLKGISYIAKCGCGEEYKVDTNLHP